MKKTISFIALVCAAVLSLTACNNAPAGDIDTSKGTLPVNASNSLADTDTSYIEIQKPSADESSSPVESVGSTDASGLIPNKGAILDDSTPLGEFTIFDKQFNIADEFTPNDMGAVLGSKFGNWGAGHSNYSWDKEKSGYQFYGAGFNFITSPYIYIEAEDENGLVTNWRFMTEDGKLPYEDYVIRGLRFEKDEMSNNFVQFVDGMEVGQLPEYYEERLGKGYEIEDTSGSEMYMHWRTDIYKTSTVTMIIEYRKGTDANWYYSKWLCESITILRND